MKTILWTQNEDPVKANTLVIDGECSEYNYDPKQDEAMKILLKGELLKACNRYDYTELRKKYGLSPNFKISIQDKKGIFIQGSYREKDVAGRNMPYMFVALGSSDLSMAVKVLRSYSAMVGKTLVEKDLAKLPDLINDLGKQKKVHNNESHWKLWIVLLFVVLSIILVLCLTVH